MESNKARSGDLYLTTNNTHQRQTSMLPAGFEPAIPASERPLTDLLDLTATRIGGNKNYLEMSQKAPYSNAKSTSP